MIDKIEQTVLIVCTALGAVFGIWGITGSAPAIVALVPALANSLGVVAAIVIEIIKAARRNKP
jgi:hypothetical protein